MNGHRLLKGILHPFNRASGAANLLAPRQNAGFPMIGKLFSNGWKNGPIFPTIGKIFRQFSNDWKKFSRAEPPSTQSFSQRILS